MGLESMPGKKPEETIMTRTAEGLRRHTDQVELVDDIIKAQIEKATTPQDIARIRKFLDERERRLKGVSR